MLISLLMDWWNFYGFAVLTLNSGGITSLSYSTRIYDEPILRDSLRHPLPAAKG